MMKDAATSFAPGSSALFVLIRKAAADKVLEGLKAFAGCYVLVTPGRGARQGVLIGSTRTDLDLAFSDQDVLAVGPTTG